MAQKRLLTAGTLLLLIVDAYHENYFGWT